MAALTSSLSTVLCPSMLTITSPIFSPAALAGLAEPPAVRMSVKATTIAPSENILIPKGVPQTVTARRSTTTARTVLTGMPPSTDSVTL